VDGPDPGEQGRPDEREGSGHRRPSPTGPDAQASRTRDQEKAR